MTVFLCRACGTSFPDAEAPPARCPICDDGRQYVPKAGQAWTTGAALAAAHRNAWQQLEPGSSACRRCRPSPSTSAPSW